MRFVPSTHRSVALWLAALMVVALSIWGIIVPSVIETEPGLSKVGTYAIAGETVSSLTAGGAAAADLQLGGVSDDQAVRFLRTPEGWRLLPGESGALISIGGLDEYAGAILLPPQDDPFIVERHGAKAEMRRLVRLRWDQSVVVLPPYAGPGDAAFVPEQERYVVACTLNDVRAFRDAVPAAPCAPGEASLARRDDSWNLGLFLGGGGVGDFEWLEPDGSPMQVSLGSSVRTSAGGDHPLNVGEVAAVFRPHRVRKGLPFDTWLVMTEPGSIQAGGHTVDIRPVPVTNHDAVVIVGRSKKNYVFRTLPGSVVALLEAPTRNAVQAAKLALVPGVDALVASRPRARVPNCYKGNLVIRWVGARSPAPQEGPPDVTVVELARPPWAAQEAGPMRVCYDESQGAYVADPGPGPSMLDAAINAVAHQNALEPGRRVLPPGSALCAGGTVYSLSMPDALRPRALVGLGILSILFAASVSFASYVRRYSGGTNPWALVGALAVALMAFLAIAGLLLQLRLATSHLAGTLAFVHRQLFAFIVAFPAAQLVGGIYERWRAEERKGLIFEPSLALALGSLPGAAAWLLGVGPAPALAVAASSPPPVYPALFLGAVVVAVATAPLSVPPWKRTLSFVWGRLRPRLPRAWLQAATFFGSFIALCVRWVVSAWAWWDGVQVKKIWRRNAANDIRLRLVAALLHALLFAATSVGLALGIGLLARSSIHVSQAAPAVVVVALFPRMLFQWREWRGQASLTPNGDSSLSSGAAVTIFTVQIALAVGFFLLLRHALSSPVPIPTGVFLVSLAALGLVMFLPIRSHVPAMLRELLPGFVSLGLVAWLARDVGSLLVWTPVFAAVCAAAIQIPIIAYGRRSKIELVALIGASVAVFVLPFLLATIAVPEISALTPGAADALHLGRPWLRVELTRNPFYHLPGDWLARVRHLAAADQELAFGVLGTDAASGGGNSAVNWIPNMHSDVAFLTLRALSLPAAIFVAAAIAALCVILLLAALEAYRRMRRSPFPAPERSILVFCMLIIAVAAIVFQCLVHVAFVIPWMPPTGIPAPFVSYGPVAAIVFTVLVLTALRPIAHGAYEPEARR